VYDAASRTVRQVLARSGCDVVIGRPLHPAVFRLLVTHALYTGPERRLLRRAALAAPVKLRVGRRQREATLIQLSLRGCGLVSSQNAAIGDNVEVTLPSELTGGDPLTISCRVLGVGDASSVGGRARDIAVGFRSTSPIVRTLLQGVMERHSFGITTSPPRPKAKQRSQAKVQPIAETAVERADAADEPAAAGAEERAGPRKLYSRRVLAAGGGGTRMLIGRDLSAGGMRVRPVPGLQLGDEFKLALYGGGDHAPLVLKAVVARDDGWEGLVLHFEDVGESLASQLESLVESLPATRAEKGVGAREPGVVVSEILERG
jgi:hypothetical protein